MAKKISILILTITIGLFSCQSSKKENQTEEVTTETAQISNDLTFTTSDQAQSCSPRILKRNTENGLILLSDKQLEEIEEKAKKLDKDLPIIGLLMYDNVLTTELTAPMDVFTKHTEDGKKLFNVITIAET